MAASSARNQHRAITCRALVIATGTFLDARMFVGDRVIEGGRSGERAAIALGDQIREIGLGQGRLKTGTPPRLDGRTIDWARLEEQPSESDSWTMSALNDGIRQPQLACAITRTNAVTHEIIEANLDRSPLVRRRDRGARASLLPVDRGQGEAVRRSRRSSDLP
jgi:tRNA uridine 5-carboxymethylaminomethyl modification enzyme